MTKRYLEIIKHYESCLEKYGDTYKGVDWSKEEDVNLRHEVMLGVINTKDKTKLLDFGCGTAHLLGYIEQTGKTNIDYSGLEISEKFINVCKKKFPRTNFLHLDALDHRGKLPEFDHIIMSGIFTEKQELSFDEMFEYFKDLITVVFSKAKKGLAFNVMSKQVDWEREDLFHLPFDKLADFLTKSLSRKFVIRNDYLPYEYTVYLYK